MKGDLADQARISVRLVNVVERGTATMTEIDVLSLSDALGLCLADVLSD